MMRMIPQQGPVFLHSPGHTSEFCNGWRLGTQQLHLNIIIFVCRPPFCGEQNKQINNLYTLFSLKKANKQTFQKSEYYLCLGFYTPGGMWDYGSKIRALMRIQESSPHAQCQNDEMLMKWKCISELLKFCSSQQSAEWEKPSEDNDKNRIKTFGSLSLPPTTTTTKSFRKSAVKISIFIGSCCKWSTVRPR